MKLPKGFSLYKDKAHPKSGFVYCYWLEYEPTGQKVCGHLDHFESFDNMVRSLYNLLDGYLHDRYDD